MHFSPESGQALLLYPINWFARSVWQFFWFMGWPRTGLANMLNETWDNLTLPGTRFWQDERTDAGSGPINDWRIRALGA